MTAEIGKRFPDFSLQNQDGKTVKLDDFAGKWLVLYVYPKDDTPGCTIQGKSFTATKQEFDDAKIAVVGVSADDVESHKSFSNKFAFTIDLLADPNHELLTAAGVGQSDYKGTMYWDRTSFVIDPEGTLRKTYEKVNPDGMSECCWTISRQCSLRPNPLRLVDPDSGLIVLVNHVPGLAPSFMLSAAARTGIEVWRKKRKQRTEDPRPKTYPPMKLMVREGATNAGSLM